MNHTASEKFGYPLSLWTYPGNLDDNLRNKINSALYVVTSTGSSAPADITFDYSDGNLSVHKTFHFDHSYVVDAKTSVQVKGSNVTAFPMWPSGFGDQVSAPQYASSQIAFQYDGKVERLNNSSWSVFPSIKVIAGNTVPGPFHWAGVSEQYFSAVFMPADPQNAALVTLRGQLEIPHNPSDPNDKRIDKMDVFGAAVGSLKGPTEERLYVGPKSLADLEAVSVPGISGSDHDLRAVVDFGWLGLIARPLFLWLKWTYYHIVRNWGWAILLQTLIINVALLPLRLSQMKSMLKMQRVAPQIKAIQEKYKKYSLRDPRKAEMNTEISALYKKEGVNPAGGCLPLVIQMPFLFAYYRMLGVAIDLASCALAMDSRSGCGRSKTYSADCDHHHHAHHAAYDAASGHGPVAAENDEHHDAGNDGRHQLESAGWTRPLLVGGTVDRHRAASSHEPHLARPRDARDDGEARQKER